LIDLKKQLRDDVNHTQPSDLWAAIQTRARASEGLPQRGAHISRSPKGRLAAAIVGLGLFATIVAGLWSVLRNGGLQPVTPTCGVWTKLASPGTGTLEAVDAVSPTDVWAVGTRTSADGSRSVLLHFDGRNWTPVDHPDVGDIIDVLEIAPDDVWAIGTRALHFDGSTWTVVRLPGPDTPFAFAPSAISAVSPDDVWLTGVKVTETMEGEVLHWNGSTWSTVETPLTGSADSSSLYGVSATSATDVWVAGSRGNVQLTMHWDGSTWRLDRHPSQDTFGVFWDIAQVRAGDVWAVGNGIEHFDGSAWSQIGPSVFGQLSALTVIDAADVWAVGGPGLILHFDGSTWASEPSPAPSSTFLDVSAAGGQVWAVGTQPSGHMLLAHFCP
jgi:hypothetical protein